MIFFVYRSHPFKQYLPFIGLFFIFFLGASPVHSQQAATDTAHQVDLIGIAKNVFKIKPKKIKPLNRKTAQDKTIEP